MEGFPKSKGIRVLSEAGAELAVLEVEEGQTMGAGSIIGETCVMLESMGVAAMDAKSLGIRNLDGFNVARAGSGNTVVLYSTKGGGSSSSLSCGGGEGGANNNNIPTAADGSLGHVVVRSPKGAVDVEIPLGGDILTRACEIFQLIPEEYKLVGTCMVGVHYRVVPKQRLKSKAAPDVSIVEEEPKLQAKCFVHFCSTDADPVAFIHKPRISRDKAIELACYRKGVKTIDYEMLGTDSIHTFVKEGEHIWLEKKPKREPLFYIIVEVPNTWTLELVETPREGMTTDDVVVAICNRFSFGLDNYRLEFDGTLILPGQKCKLIRVH